MASIGRNDPCPCGSGAKFKKCCLPKREANPELLRRRLRLMDDQFNEKLISHSVSLYGEAGILEAWNEYWFGDARHAEPDLNDPESQAFLPWYLYNWVPGKRSVFPKTSRLKVPIARDYLEKSRGRLADSECRFLQAVLDQSFSFHEVLDCDSGKGFQLQDVLTGQERYVLEQSGSANTRKGDIFFGRAVSFDAIHLMIGCGATLLPPIDKIEILDLKEWIEGRVFRIGNPELKYFEEPIRETYVSLRDRLHFSPPPGLRNTDGEDFCLHTLRYEIPSIINTVQALRSLALDLSQEEILEDAKRDEKGNLVEIEIPWLKKGNRLHKTWENTVLGHLTIRENKMEVHVNSRKRAERIKKEISRRLGDEARLVHTVIQSGESLAKQAQEGSKSTSREEDESSRLLKEYPELREETEKFLADHWKGWLDEKIPALDGLTPRQASKKASHRERLQALLAQFERENESSGSSFYCRAPVEELRLELGLPSE